METYGFSTQLADAAVAGRDLHLDPQDLPEVQEWLAQKDREWLDLDIPALDGKTPREAAKDRRLRPRLRSLLMLEI